MVGRPQVAMAQNDSGCDCMAEDMPPGQLGPLICHHLAHKGFAVIGKMVDDELIKQALKDAHRLDAEARFDHPPAELQDALLGPEGSVRIAELKRCDEPDEERYAADGEAMTELDGMMSAVGYSMMEHVERLGFDMSHRCTSIVHQAGKAEASETPLTEKAVNRWLAQILRHKVMVLIGLGPASGTLELRPHEAEGDAFVVAKPYEVDLDPGTMVVLRPDMLSHKLSAEKTWTLSCWYLQGRPFQKHSGFTYTPVAKVLDAWVMNRIREIKQAEDEDSVWDPKIPREWQRCMNRMYHKGQMIAVRGVSCRLPTSWESDTLAKVCTSGPDFVTQVPFGRWDHEAIFDEDPESWRQFKSYCRHTSFTDGVELFDTKLFGISPVEARVMDPNQRIVLELAYDALFRMGLTKSTILNTPAGVYMGTAVSEWQYVEKEDNTWGAHGATGAAASITSNRISFVLGMKGPSMSVDTEGAAGLTALSLAAESVQKKGRSAVNKFALGMASFLQLAPTLWPQMCAAGWLSKHGRCLTFDCSADGYVRADGSAAAALAPLHDKVDGEDVPVEGQPLVGVLAGAAMNSNGRGASLSAPNGPAEQLAIADAIRNVGVSPFDVDAVEANGSGAVLPDAIEIGSLLRGHRTYEQQDPLGIMASKSNVGNMMETAGLAAFIKVLFAGASGVMTPQVHLKQANPHLDVFGTPVGIVDEAIEFKSACSFVGVMSHGFGGTNVYALAMGNLDDSKLPSKDLKTQAKAEVAYWPGGGGKLAHDDVPSKGYYIAGTWGDGTLWSEPEPMSAEGVEGFGATVTLGENRWEAFQIWFDGDKEKALFPGDSAGVKDSQVLGPQADPGLCWVIDGRLEIMGIIREPNEEGGSKALEDADPPPLPKPGMIHLGVEMCTEEIAPGKSGVMDLYKHSGPDTGLPGDRYRVHLKISGKWRTVTWEKLDPPKDAIADPSAGPRGATGKYFVGGTWNDWDFLEMTRDGSTAGLYHTEVKLDEDAGFEFKVARNRDWKQAFYPGRPDNAGLTRPANVVINPKVLGPMPIDPHVPDSSWRVYGKPGDVVRIEFRRTIDAFNDIDDKDITWKTVG